MQCFNNNNEGNLGASMMIFKISKTIMEARSKNLFQKECKYLI